MAISNSTTLNDLVGQIVASQAISAAISQRVVRPLVMNYEIPQGAGSIVVPQFSGIAVASLTEGVAPSSTTWGTGGVTLTPVERGVYVQISKRALYADPFTDLAPYGDQLGRALASDEDNSLLAIMCASGAFANTVGTENVALKSNDFLSAIAKLEAANAPKPYFAVMHPASWFKIAGSGGFGDAGVFDNVGAQIVNGFGEGQPTLNGFAGAPYGVPVFISSQVPKPSHDAGDYYNVMFSKQAVAFAWMKDIGIDVFDNVTARAFDVMAWRSAHQAIVDTTFGVTMIDPV